MTHEVATGDERVFVGRERELAVFAAALAAVGSRHGQVLLLAGEPGVGKTRLATECAGRAQAEGFRVLWGRAWEGDGAPAFWPWIQLVRAYLNQADPTSLVADLGRAGSELARAMPEVEPLLPPAARLAGGGSLGLQPEQERFRFFDGLTLFLKAASRRQPLLLVLDDLQWADTPSLLLWQFLTQELADSHLLVIGTYRESELASDHPLFQVLGAVRREPVCRHVTLSGLEVNEIGRFVAARSGQQPSTELLAALAERTEGNPFFLHELVQLMLAEGTMHDPRRWRQAIPIGIRQVIGRRVASLPIECSHLLSLAAAIGRELDIELLSAVAAAELAEPEMEPRRTLGTLEPAVAAGLVHATSPTRYAFTHAMIREALYAEIDPPARPWLHRRIGEVLEQRAGDAALSELAHHFTAAGVKDKACLYARRAGDRALGALAYEEAEALYRRALDAVGRQPHGEMRLRCELLLALEEAAMRGGKVEEARTASFEAAAVAREVDDAELFARAALGFGWVFQVNVVDHQRIALLEEALTRSTQADSLTRARLLARLATGLYWTSGSLEKRVQLSAAAVAMARRLQDPATLAFALNARLFALWTAAHTNERRQEGRELLALAERVRDPELTLQSQHWVITSLLELGDLAAAEREIAAYTRLAVEIRQPLYLWFLATWKAMRALLRGDLDHVEGLAEQALKLGERVEPGNATQAYSGLMFCLRREQGRLGELLPMIESLVQQPDAIAGWRRALAFVYAEEDQLDDAAREIEVIMKGHLASLDSHDGQLMGVFTSAEAVARLGAPRLAEDLYQVLLPFAQQNGVMGMGIAVMGSTARILGILATTLDRYADAEQHFADALAMHEKLHARPLIARTQHDWAAMLLRRGEPEDVERALPLLDAALATASEIGMKSLEAKALALRQSAVGSGQSAGAETGTGVRSRVFGAGTTESAPRTPDTRHPAPDTHVFRRAGDMWTITFNGTTVQLRDTRGLQYLARVLAQPLREIHAVEVIGAPGSPASSRALHDGEVIAPDLGDAGAVLDAASTAQYQRRLGELREELAEAEANNDLGRAASLREELAFLAEQLASAGRGRRAASHAERARVTVAKGIAAAMKKIAAAHPELGRHLKATIRTGYFCSYIPDPRRDWAT